ncbi:MAG: hydroxyacylglutathione hydrolase [Hyphomicrobiales bacterium]|nr:hydroxyacylglutathione hydrolase [Hyphomicrobiales bacterium]
MPAQMRLFICLKDNFGVLLHDPGSGRTAAIDAPEAAPVEAALRAAGWTLTDILVTHHHRDHTGGIEELKDRHRCRVVAPDGEAGGIPAVDETVRDGDVVRVGALEGRVLETPGHTAAPATYYFPTEKIVFAGDTLFSIGCGRVIEGTMEQMWGSMLKLRALPDDTLLYCGHEYTLANIRFAKTVEPDNGALAARERQVTQRLAAGQASAPSPMGEEKAANPFLRADVPQIARSLGLEGASAAEVFAEIRTRKNKF